MGETNHAFVFDDLEPEPGPKFASMSRKNSKKEKERLDREYHAEREARLAAQRESQATVHVPNPLRRHTAEELLEKRAKRDAQSALMRQKHLKTVSFEN
jgi:hypothetical protein